MEALVEIEQVAHAPAGSQKIVLRSVYGKQQGKLKIQPARSMATQRLLGVELLSATERLQRPYVVDEETIIEIKDGDEFDLGNAKDAIDWQWIQHVPAIALSYEDSQMSEDALFYVLNEEKEISKRLNKKKLEHQAMSLVLNEGSKSKWYDYARLLGNRMDGLPPVAVEEYLLSVASQDPEKLIKTIEDKLAKTRLFFYNLRDKQLISRQDGLWKYGDIVLGMSEEHVLEYLRTVANEPVVELLQADLYPNLVTSKETKKK